MIMAAICDDENNVCSAIEKMLFKAAMQLNLQIQTDVYYSGERLCERLEAGEYYDIIFLDIELESQNGVEVGHFIRNKLVNDAVQIAYISGKTHYAMELFKISPIDFLVKPVEYEQLYDVVCKLVRIKKIYADTFSYKIGYDIKLETVPDEWGYTEDYWKETFTLTNVEYTPSEDEIITNFDEYPLFKNAKDMVLVYPDGTYEIIPWKNGKADYANAKRYINVLDQDVDVGLVKLEVGERIIGAYAE